MLTPHQLLAHSAPGHFEAYGCSIIATLDTIADLLVSDARCHDLSVLGDHEAAAYLVRLDVTRALRTVDGAISEAC